MAESKKIAVIGLGYVGLPLAVHLAKHFPVIGLDINERRVEELKRRSFMSSPITGKCFARWTASGSPT